MLFRPRPFVGKGFEVIQNVIGALIRGGQQGFVFMQSLVDRSVGAGGWDRPAKVGELQDVAPSFTQRAQSSGPRWSAR